MHKNRIWFQLALIVILAVAVVGSTLAINRSYGVGAFLGPIGGTHRIVMQRFITRPDEQALQRAAIQGMLDALDDPYTFYVPPADTDEFEKEMTGEYVGIGVAVAMRDGWLTVITPLDGSPAIAAGVRAGDRIVEIEGVSTADKTPDECVEMLMGEAGVPVRITVERGGTRIAVTIVRERIVTQTVRGFHRADGGRWRHVIDADRRIAYIRVSQFNQTTADEFKGVIEGLGVEEPGRLGALIIDLRGNPGGLMSASIAMADLFLSEGIIVSTRGRALDAETILAHREGTLGDFPIVVMIDGQSASASEIFAGALADNDRAVILGERSFGKASIQQVYTLSRTNAELKITEGRYQLPSGRSPHREPGSTEWGVDPSPGFFVPMSGQEWLDAMTTQQDQEVIRTGTEDATDWSDTEGALAALGDRQLTAAVGALQTRIDTGLWVPVGADAPSGEQLIAEDLERLDRSRQALLRDLALLERSARRHESAGIALGEPIDLWPDDTDLAGGRLEVFDARGNRIAQLSITGDDLERWLQASGVEPTEAEGSDDG